MVPYHYIHVWPVSFVPKYQQSVHSTNCGCYSNQFEFLLHNRIITFLQAKCVVMVTVCTWAHATHELTVCNMHALSRLQSQHLIGYTSSNWRADWMSKTPKHPGTPQPHTTHISPNHQDHSTGCWPTHVQHPVRTWLQTSRIRTWKPHMQWPLKRGSSARLTGLHLTFAV